MGLDGQICWVKNMIEHDPVTIVLFFLVQVSRMHKCIALQVIVIYASLSIIEPAKLDYG